MIKRKVNRFYYVYAPRSHVYHRNYGFWREGAKLECGTRMRTTWEWCVGRPKGRLCKRCEHARYHSGAGVQPAASSNTDTAAGSKVRAGPSF